MYRGGGLVTGGDFHGGWASFFQRVFGEDCAENLGLVVSPMCA